MYRERTRMKINLHQEIHSVDIPKLQRLYPLQSNFAELSSCIDAIIKKISQNPYLEGVPCKRPPLLNWRRLKFHSKHRPLQGTKADMRIIFREYNGVVFIFCIGKRIQKDPDDVYFTAHNRNP